MENKRVTLVLLPGLNGTEGLFDPLLSVATDEYDLIVMEYPADEVKSYAELTEYVLEKIRGIEGRFVLLGESFSGPIAVMLAAKKIQGLIGIILVATFVNPPYSTIFKYLPWTLIFTLAKPIYWLRIKLSSATTASILKAASVELQKVKPRVLAERIKSALTIDVSRSLEVTKIPVMYFCANYDVVVPGWNLRKILSIKPDTNVTRFNTLHFLLQSTPQDAWNAIDSFIKKLIG